MSIEMLQNETVDEVREWGRFSDAEKLAVKARAAARLAGGQDAD